MKAEASFVALCSLALVACEKPTPGVSEPPATTEAEASISRPLVETVDPTVLTTICKTAIATLFGRPVAIIEAKRPVGGIVRTSYRRASDNTLWKNDCRLEGQRIIWRSVDASPGLGAGRWRDHPDDGVLTFTMEGGNVAVEETY